MDVVLIGHNERIVSRDVWQKRFAGRTTGKLDADLSRILSLHWANIDDTWLRPLDAVSHLRTTGEGSSAVRPWYSLGEEASTGCLYLASYLRRRGVSSTIINFFPAELDRFEDILLHDNPPVVAISTSLIINPRPLIEITEFIRERSPDTCIVIGGAYVPRFLATTTGAQRGKVLSLIGGDVYVDSFQGESVLLRVVQAIKKGEPLESVPNLYVVSNEKAVYTGKKPESNDIDEGIDWGMFSKEELGKTVRVRTVRSCAYKCSFCSFPLAGPLETQAIDVVERELEQLHSLGVENITFVDDTFNVPVRRFEDLLRMMIRRKFNFRWMSFLRMGNINKEDTFDLIKDSGCLGTFCGFESGDEGILKNMKKAIKVEKLKWGAQQFHKRGLEFHASLITGFPGETWESIDNTIQFVEDIAPTYYKAAPFFYDTRAPISKEADKYGLTGDGFSWSHNTMDTGTAVNAVHYMRNTVRNSTWITTDYFSYFAVPYLMGKGLSLKNIFDFISQFNDVVDVSHPFVFRTSPDIVESRNKVVARFKNLVRDLPFRPSRYRWLEEGNPIDAPAFRAKVDGKAAEVVQIMNGDYISGNETLPLRLRVVS